MMHWDPKLISKYNINGPRYTSYPTALALNSDFDQNTIPRAIEASPSELSIYIHIPFCHKLCYYCGCNKLITRHQHKADIYLDALAKEMSHYAAIFGNKRINQLHLGGGTPTFLTEQQLTHLMALFNQNFALNSDAEISIEIDPRSCSDQKLNHLVHLGFNRVSYGVQDLDEKVQIAINRVQDTELIRHQIQLSRQLGFDSINLDLIYGLPFQHPDSFAQTLQEIITLNPDRVSLFSYAHLPERFAAQRKLNNASLPNAQLKLQLQQMGIKAFVEAGYQFIGMDHFAKPEDSLALAQRQRKLQRNFQGYTTTGQDALIGLGVSSISQVNGVLWQNSKELPAYYKNIDNGILPVERGFELSDDDKLRAALISQLICHFELDIEAFCQKWKIDNFAQFFEQELQRLQPFIEDNLIHIQTNKIVVTATGRLWVRSICACFDAYLQQSQQRYSKVV